MKRICFLSLLIICFASCTHEPAVPDEPQEPYVEARVVSASQMEQECNNTLTALKWVIDARDNNDIATLMEAITEDSRTVGYKIRTKKHGYLYVYLDFLCPDYNYLPVGIEYKDSIPYWTVDGEIFKDAYDCVYTAEQSALDFQNRYGGLRFKYDSGSMYRLYCKDSEYFNLSILKSVSHSNGKIDFQLSNGTILSMDWLEDFDIYYSDAQELLVHPGNSVRVMFTAQGATENSEISVDITKGWTADINMISTRTGYLIVTAPQDATQSILTVSLKDGTNQVSRSTVIKSSDLSVPMDEYELSQEECVLEVPVTTQLYYELELSDDSKSWISSVPTNNSQLLKFNVKENSGKAQRTALICLNDICGNTIKSFQITQKGVNSFDYETDIASFRLQSDDPDDFYTIRGNIVQLLPDSSLVLMEDDASVKIQTPVNSSAFSSRLVPSARLVVRGHKSSEKGEPLMTEASIKIIIDHTHRAQTPWMELPADDPLSGLEFFHHSMTVSGEQTRNYSFYWDYTNLVAHWVAYPLNVGLIGTGSRTDIWGMDPLLPRDKQPVLLTPFKNCTAGFNVDRGHQCPSADRLNYSSNVETFYGTNMTPQMGTLNQRMWANFEGKVRSWSALCDTLYVVTGCTVSDALGYAFDNDGKKVTVPGHYFKVLLAHSKNSSFGHSGYMAAAFYIEHKECAFGNVTPAMSMSVEDLEALTGIDFFANLPYAVGSATAEEIEKEKPALAGYWF